MAAGRLLTGLQVLVVEHEEDAGLGLVGERLALAGVEVTVVGPSAGRDVPTSVGGHDGLIVLGGRPGPTDDHVAAWLPRVRALVADSLATGTPYLGICLGAQLLAVVAGGAVREAARGPELGVTRLSMTDAASGDPLLDGLPAEVVALQWHYLEIAELPEGAVSLCSSARCDNQAFRVGSAWGIQFHLEGLGRTAEDWAAEGDELRGLGIDPAALVREVQDAEDELRAVWSQVADRWIGVVADQAGARSA